MKTKEFIKRVKELGFEVRINSRTAYILNDKTTIVRVEIDKAFVIDCFYLLNWTLEEEIREKLFDLIVEYAVTPVKAREEEKKFYLKHRYLQSSLTNSNNILCYSASDDKLALCNGINFPKYKTYLTLKEIEEIKEKFDTDLVDVELVEVVDE